jgi:hypothetical protein
MQLVGTRAGARRADRADGPDFGGRHQCHRDWRGDPALPARAPGGADTRCSASHRRRICSRWRPTISSQSRHSARTVPIQRSANALALGACTGVRSTWAPSERKTSSNPRQNFASRSRSRKPSRRPRSPKTMRRLRACWVTQTPLGLAVIPARWTRRVSSSMKPRPRPRSSPPCTKPSDSSAGPVHDRRNTSTASVPMAGLEPAHL